MKKGKSPSLHQVTLLAMCRRVGRSILLIALATIGVFSSMVLLNVVTRQEEGVEAVQKSTAIRCTVTNARGMSSERLEMTPDIVDKLLGRTDDQTLSQYVDKVEAKATSAMVMPQGYNLCRIFSFRSDSRLDTLNGVTITMLGDWTEDAFRTDQKICIVPVGMETETKGGRQYITAKLTGGEEETLEVVGTVEGGPEAVIYCPYDMVLSGNVTFLVESCSFIIQDNTLLDDEAITYKAWYKESVSTDMETSSRAVESVGGALAELTIGRIRADKSPILRIRNSETGEDIVRLPLAEYALMVKGQYNLGMSSQEYLDRVDEYNMTLFLNEGEWVSTSILIHSWRVVINNTVLE